MMVQAYYSQFSSGGQKLAEISGSEWWAQQGLNLRPLRCEHKTPQQIRHFLPNKWRDFAILGSFRSLCVPPYGTVGTSAAPRFPARK